MTSLQTVTRFAPAVMVQLIEHHRVFVAVSMARCGGRSKRRRCFSFGAMFLPEGEGVVALNRGEGYQEEEA